MQVVCAVIICILVKICNSSRDSYFTPKEEFLINQFERRPQKIYHPHDRHHKSKPPLDNRIINGEVAQIENYPFMACLIEENTNDTLFRGGATIIHLNWVVTAAHCLSNTKGIQAGGRSNLYVRSNTHMWNFYYQEHRVIKMHIHKKYKKGKPDYDLAIVKVQELFRGNNEKPIKLATRKYKYEDESDVTVLGWGKVEPIGREPIIEDELRFASIQLKNLEDCKQTYKEIITHRMICASAPGRDACLNDSGGALMQNDTLIGIVIWAYKDCAEEGQPSVYIKISEFSGWISKTMKQCVRNTHKIVNK